MLVGDSRKLKAVVFFFIHSFIHSFIDLSSVADLIHTACGSACTAVLVSMFRLVQWIGERSLRTAKGHRNYTERGQRGFEKGRQRPWKRPRKGPETPNMAQDSSTGLVGPFARQVRPPKPKRAPRGPRRGPRQPPEGHRWGPEGGREGRRNDSGRKS